MELHYSESRDRSNNLTHLYINQFVEKIRQHRGLTNVDYIRILNIDISIRLSIVNNKLITKIYNVNFITHAFLSFFALSNKLFFNFITKNM